MKLQWLLLYHLRKWFQVQNKHVKSIDDVIRKRNSPQNSKNVQIITENAVQWRLRKWLIVGKSPNSVHSLDSHQKASYVSLDSWVLELSPHIPAVEGLLSFLLKLSQNNACESIQVTLWRKSIFNCFLLEIEIKTIIAMGIITKTASTVIFTD